MTPKTASTLLAVLTGAIALALPGAGALAAGVRPTGGASAPAGPVRASVRPLTGSGIATWFGPGLYGNRTACGQTLTPTVVGVANRTLPCGTLVKVTYGGRSLVVPVLDRGPYGRIGAEWDLTTGAAVALHVTQTVHVATHVVGSAANGPTLGLPAGAAAAAPLAGTLAGGSIAA